MSVQRLMGKTIKAVTRLKYPNYDDMAWLKLDFTDNSFCVLEGGYAGWTGKSIDEFQTYIDECDEISGLVPFSEEEFEAWLLS